jgi:hypothetical protein
VDRENENRSEEIKGKDHVGSKKAIPGNQDLNGS